jgi:NADH dehydrogenase (ubiquinone) 1 alpha subcomplex subunit 6
LTLYDIDMPLLVARDAIRDHFTENSKLRDERVIDMVVEKGYMEMEETLLQHKQRSHLLRVFEGYVLLEGASRKKLDVDSSIDAQFARN